MTSKVSSGDKVRLWLCHPQYKYVNATVTEVTIDEASQIFIKASTKYYEYGKTRVYDVYNDDHMTVVSKTSRVKTSYENGNHSSHRRSYGVP